MTMINTQSTSTIQPLAHLAARFYPIAPDYQTTQLYINQGIKFLQIRLKEMSDHDIKYALKSAIKLAKSRNVTLVINDYWQYAIEYQADWIHLGQEDLQSANLNAITQANIKLGISTHDDHELNIALEHQPHYIALGPVYFTKLKAMKWAPQGLEKVKIWKQKCAHIPLVAIGGITLEKAPIVLDAGADCVSFVTDITHHLTPEIRLKQWIDSFG